MKLAWVSGILMSADSTVIEYGFFFICKKRTHSMRMHDSPYISLICIKLIDSHAHRICQYGERFSFFSYSDELCLLLPFLTHTHTAALVHTFTSTSFVSNFVPFTTFIDIFKMENLLTDIRHETDNICIRFGAWFVRLHDFIASKQFTNDSAIAISITHQNAQLFFFNVTFRFVEPQFSCNTKFAISIATISRQNKN